MRAKGAMERLSPKGSRPERKRFEARGYLGPLGVLSRPECRAVMRLAHRRRPAVWSKGQAARSPAFHRLATHPPILERIEALLGPDVMLWGASLVQKHPGEPHPWHTDVETSGEQGGSVSVWVVIEALGRPSRLRLVPGSHRFGESLQRVAARAGKARDELDDAPVRSWASARAPRSRIVELEVRDGQAVFFHGHLWHASDGAHSAVGRTALLLQYATPDAEIRIPDPSSDFSWPFRFLDVRPPCIMVRGKDRFGINEIVAPPAREADAAARRGPPESESTPELELCMTTQPDAQPLWPCWIAPLGPGEARSRGSGWGTRPLFEGSARSVERLSSHVSLLEPQISPHRPHRHPEEELIVLLSGEAEVVTPGAPGDLHENVQRISRGDVVYHPANAPHTIRALGSRPASYLIFKWQGDRAEPAGARLAAAVVDPFEETGGRPLQPVPGFTCTTLFQGPTHYLAHLQCHLTTLEPGAGYPPHRDDYDVAVVVLDGSLETLGRRVGPDNVIFYAAQELHGMRNVGDERATYLVFELHGSGSHAAVDPERWEAIRNWTQRCDRIALRLAEFAPADGDLVLLDDGQLLGIELARGRRVLPFLERDGEYWGRPSDGASAIRELERLRASGACCLAVAWPAFWWLEHYADFAAHLRSRYRVLSEDEDLLVVDLQGHGASEREMEYGRPG